MAKRKDYNKLDFTSIVTGNLRKGNVEAARNEARKALSKKQNTSYNIGVNNYKEAKSKLLPAVIIDNSEYVEKVKSSTPIQLEENKEITNKLTRNKAWVDRLEFNKEILNKRNESLKELDKRLGPNMFKNEILKAHKNRDNDGARYNKLIDQLVKIYKEIIDDYKYIEENEEQLKAMFTAVSSRFKKPWETEVYTRLKNFGLDKIVDEETKQMDPYRNRPDILTESQLKESLKLRSPLSNSELYNLLYAFKAMPTASKQGIMDTFAKIAKTNKAILAGTKYEKASYKEQGEFVKAWWATFREWSETIDKSIYDSEDAIQAFSSINFDDIENVSLNDIIAKELKEKYDKRAEERLNQEIELENMFENTSRFRVKVDERQRTRKSKNNNKTDMDNWNELINEMDEDELNDLRDQLNRRQKEIDNERSTNFKL